MGYRGFHHLLSDRATNLDVCFVNPGEPWPFRDESVALLHAADSIHRFPWPAFRVRKGTLRVTTRDGAVVFPHAQIPSNSEPDPFFERRGGRHLHGREYHAWLSAAGRGAQRRWIGAQRKAFSSKAPQPQSSPTTATLRITTASSRCSPRRRPPPVTPTLLAPESTRYALNPLFSLSISRGQWRVNPHLHGKSVAHLLDRHPVYQDKLPTGAVEVHDSTLSGTIPLAPAGETTEQITAAFHPVQPVRRWLQFLEEQELVRGVPMSAAGQRMQRFQCEPASASGHRDCCRVLARLSSTSRKYPSLLPDGISRGPTSTRWRGFSQVRCPSATAKTSLSMVGGNPVLLWFAIVAASCGVSVRLEANGTDLPPDCGLLVSESDRGGARVMGRASRCHYAQGFGQSA